MAARSGRSRRPAQSRHGHVALCERPIIEHDDIAATQAGHQPALHHSMNRGVFIAPHVVLNVSQRSTRIAPTSVRLSPQFRGRASTRTLPRGTHAYDRPIAKFAPDSSRNTKRRTSTRRSTREKRGARPGLSGCLVPRAASVILKTYPVRCKRPQHTRPMDVRFGCGALVVRARQLLGRAVRTLLEHGVQQGDIDR